MQRLRWPVALDGRALSGGGLPEKKFAIIFGFFRIFITECFSGTRQRLCRVPDKKHLAKASLLINFLPSAALGKAFAECISGFAECRMPVSSSV